MQSHTYPQANYSLLQYAFVLEQGATSIQNVDNAIHTNPLTAANLDTLFACLSARLVDPKYRLPSPPDIDYLAAYTDALLERDGLRSDYDY